MNAATVLQITFNSVLHTVPVLQCERATHRQPWCTMCFCSRMDYSLGLNRGQCSRNAEDLGHTLYKKWQHGIFRHKQLHLPTMYSLRGRARTAWALQRVAKRPPSEACLQRARKRSSSARCAKRLSGPLAEQGGVPVGMVGAVAKFP